MNRLPLELINIIRLYAHPVINKDLQKQIHNHTFYKKKINIKYIKNMKYCNICLKNHRYPKHFKCL